MNFRLLVREKAKIHRSHKRVLNGLVVDIYTMWFNSIVPPLHGFCACMHGCVHDKQPEIHCRLQEPHDTDHRLVWVRIVVLAGSLKLRHRASSPGSA